MDLMAGVEAKLERNQYVYDGVGKNQVIPSRENSGEWEAPVDSSAINRDEIDENHSSQSADGLISFLKGKSNFEKASEKVREYDPAIMGSFDNKEFKLVPLDDVDPEHDTRDNEINGQTIHPEKDGGPITVEVQTKDDDKKRPGGKINRDPLEIGEDMVHEYYHAKMAKELHITKSEYNKPALHEFVKRIGEALCYKKGADFVEDMGGEVNDDHAKKRDFGARNVYLIECLMNNRKPDYHNNMEANIYENVLKDKFKRLTPEQREKVKGYLEFYHKNLLDYRKFDKEAGDA